MDKLIIITPIKDSVNTAVETIKAVTASHLSVPHTYTIYDDNSTPENAARLDKVAAEAGCQVIHLSELTSHPSPNYLFVLRRVQQEALAEGAAVCIVESDVTVRPDTLQKLCDGADARHDCGIAAAVTVDEEGQINYPYNYAKGQENRVIDNRRHQSFCCSLLTPALLRSFDFANLDDSKAWFDVTISHESLALGLHNYLFTTLPVTHRPHQSRPWKQLKYKNPLKYYWLKLTKGLDKI